MERLGIFSDLARAGIGAGLRRLAALVDPAGEVLRRARRAVEDDEERLGEVPPVVSPEAREMIAGQVNIRQSFEDADPDKIVEVFRRDVERAAGRRVVVGD